MQITIDLRVTFMTLIDIQLSFLEWKNEVNNQVSFNLWESQFDLLSLFVKLNNSFQNCLQFFTSLTKARLHRLASIHMPFALKCNRAQRSVYFFRSPWKAFRFSCFLFCESGNHEERYFEKKESWCNFL